jgi:hypothetical protein
MDSLQRRCLRVGVGIVTSLRKKTAKMVIRKRCKWDPHGTIPKLMHCTTQLRPQWADFQLLLGTSILDLRLLIGRVATLPSMRLPAGSKYTSPVDQQIESNRDRPLSLHSPTFPVCQTSPICYNVISSPKVLCRSYLRRKYASPLGPPISALLYDELCSPLSISGHIAALVVLGIYFH